MNGRFSRGLIIGSIIGASVGIMVNNNMMHSQSRKRMMRTGKSFLRKSGDIIGGVVDAFR